MSRGSSRARIKYTVIAAVLATVCSTATATAAPSMPAPDLAYGQTRDFAAVPLPGQPEGIAVDPNDGSVWSGSNRPNSSATLWHWDSSGVLLQTYQLDGHLPAEHGINGITLDGDGRVYALDYSGARAVRLDPNTGEQVVYATFADLPTCAAAPAQPCEPSPIDSRAWPNWATFAPDGTMYVSDLGQATIWAVPPGGGPAKIWYQNRDFASIYSVNGMQFDAEGRLNFVVTLSVALDPSTFGRGVIYRLGITPDGAPTALERVAVTAQGDGIAIGSSGRIYVATSNPLDNSIQVVDPRSGSVIDAIPPLLDRITRSIPYSTPASLGFRGTSLMISNHALLAVDAHQYAVLELGVGETGLPLIYPRGIA